MLSGFHAGYRLSRKAISGTTGVAGYQDGLRTSLVGFAPCAGTTACIRMGGITGCGLFPSGVTASGHTHRLATEAAF